MSNGAAWTGRNMGIDMSWQSLPTDCDFIDRCLHDIAFGELAYFTPRWIRGKGPIDVDMLNEGWPEAERLFEWLDGLVTRYPGIEFRNWENESRSWDILHYLLSANRRGETATEKDLILDGAVLGAVEIAPHVRGSQGHLTRYTSAQQVAQAAAILDSVSLSKLKTHFIPEKMNAAGVYKFSPDHPDIEWERTRRDFDCFRAFYLEAAEHNEFVIAALS